ncbi:MAG: SDR family oxidoreductase [Myxococcota bacterium]|nr:SDR family oxidoreductase [Myxococcota bacterium]
MARILVTGGAGFVGSNLVHALLARGDEVVVIDNFSTGRIENLADVRNRIKLIEGSLADPKAVSEALEGVDGVLHQGALPSVPKSLALPLETNEANIVGTLTLLEMCRKKDVQRVVYAASSSAYGDHDAPIKTETLEPRPKSPYAVQKLTGEYYCSVYHQLFGINTVALRYFNVFGRRQNPSSQYAAVVPAFVTRILQGKAPVVYGDGTQSRDFTHIDNVIDANFKALDAPSDVCGRVYNVGCGSSVTLLDLIESINKTLGTEVKPQFDPPRAGDVMHSRADIEQTRKNIGYNPEVDFNEGLRRTIDWYRRTN